MCACSLYAQYNDIEWAKAPALDQPEELAAAAAASSDPQPAPFETAMTVEARVVSRNHAGLATVDAGFKALSSEDGPPTVRSGAPKGSTYTFMGDEHGILTFPKDADPAECPGECTAPDSGAVQTHINFIAVLICAPYFLFIFPPRLNFANLFQRSGMWVHLQLRIATPR
jgi:hypothetical protein